MTAPLTLRHSLFAAEAALDALLADAALVDRAERAADTLAASLRAGHKILACGNGGSLCDAAHFAEELTGRVRADRPPLAAIACADAGHLTCVANDYGFDEVFARWVRGLGRPGDVLVVLSTSGNSENIRRAIVAAKDANLRTVALLGRGGGKCRDLAEQELIVPGDTSDRIQELHMLLLHAWVEAIESRLFPSPG